MMKRVMVDFYMNDHQLEVDLGDKVIKKDNTGFEFPDSKYHPHVAEVIGFFDNGSTINVVVRGYNESGSFSIGYMKPEELYIVG